MTESSTFYAWEYEELQAWLRLSLTPSVGNGSARRLLMHFGLPTAIFSASAAALGRCVSAPQVTQLCQEPARLHTTLQTTWQWLQHADPDTAHALIALGDPRYPESLLHIADPPLMLYAIGPRSLLQAPQPIVHAAHSLAIVGSRNPTPQGASNAYQFAKHLTANGWCIVSGMALGIDAAAHQGALDAQVQHPSTVAVLGTGLDHLYPRTNAPLAQHLVRNGVLLSEFPLGTPPIAHNFPKRNRIIAGLSRGTLVVEATLASGSLVTARIASEQGKEVFALPGSIHNPQTRGCHALIKQGAKLVETASDILEELSPLPDLPPTTVCHPTTVPNTVDNTDTTYPTTGKTPSEMEDPLLRAMGYDPVSIDSLASQTGLGTAQLQAQLLALELDNWVQRLPGGLYQRKALA